MKKSLTVFCIFLLFDYSVIFAQSEEKFPDTLVIQTSENIKIQILMKDYSLINSDTLIKSIITQFQSDINKITPQIPDYNRYKIVYRHGQTIEVVKLSDFALFKINDSLVEADPLYNHCEIMLINSRIIIHFSRLSDILNPDIQKWVNAAIKKFPEKSRKPKTMYYNPVQDSISPPDICTASGCASQDAIQVSLMAGTSLIKNTLVPDFSIYLGYSRKKKSQLQTIIYIADYIHYYFDSKNYGLSTYHFLTLGGRTKLSPNEFTGLELGYLVVRKGDFLNPNTFKIGISKSYSKPFHFSLSANLYFYEGFKKMYPGFRFGIGI